jgi:hypothetical protein
MMGEFMKKLTIFAAAAAAVTATAAIAAPTFDPATGTGFVGKGDVQLALGLNNRGLQNTADSLQFEVRTVEVEEVTWTCTNSNNLNDQIRDRTIRTTTRGVVAAVARVRNQITGFDLTGYSGTTDVQEQESGNQLDSCPGGANWSLTVPAGDPEVVSSVSHLKVNGSDL